MVIEDKERALIEGIFGGDCSKNNICPVKDILATFSDKWSIYAILLLGQHNKMRFNELRGEIHGISQRMLTVTLRSLQQNGLVSRSIYHEIPPRVEYELTELGESLLKQVILIANWAENNGSKIIASRSLYDPQPSR